MPDEAECDCDIASRRTGSRVTASGAHGNVEKSGAHMALSTRSPRLKAADRTQPAVVNWCGWGTLNRSARAAHTPLELRYRPFGVCMVLLLAAPVVIAFTRMAVVLIQKKSRGSLTGGF